MSRLRIGVLEDEPEKLKDLVDRLRETQLVEVVAHSCDKDAFLREVEVKRPEALILDIDLSGEPDGGIEVARRLRLPVLFISGHVAKHTEAIELLDAHNAQVHVTHLSKLASDGVFRAKLEKFVGQVTGTRLYATIKLRDLRSGEEIETTSEQVVCISVDPSGAGSNNKVIHFKHRRPVKVADLSLSRLDEFGFPVGHFVQIARNRVVNKAHISYKVTTSVCVAFIDATGRLLTEEFPVKESFRKNLT